jgi:hypothetical protein
MNFVFLSIVCCLLLSNINYASENKSIKKTGWTYSFPLLRAIGIVRTNQTDAQSDPANCIPKTTSQKNLANTTDTEQFWVMFDQQEAISATQTEPTTPATSPAHAPKASTIVSSNPLLSQSSATTFNVLTSHVTSTNPSAHSTAKQRSEEFDISYDTSKTNIEKTQFNCNDTSIKQPNRTGSPKTQVHAPQVNWQTYSAELPVFVANNQSNDESSSSDLPITENKGLTPTKFMEISRNSDSSITPDEANVQSTLYDTLCGCCKNKKKSSK